MVALVRLPEDPVQLAAALPDEPRWIETRSLLRSGDCVVRILGGGDSALVLDAAGTSGSLVGGAHAALLRAALADVAPEFELLVQVDALDAARAACPGWTITPVVVHCLPRAYLSVGPPAPRVLVSTAPPPSWFEGVPEDFGYAASAHAVAAQFVEGRLVAVCAAADVTETLWDVGIDTVAEHRRRGYATACFRALAAHLAAAGKQPVWSAYAHYPPSLELAAKLGFEEVARSVVLSPSADLLS